MSKRELWQWLVFCSAVLGALGVLIEYGDANCQAEAAILRDNHVEPIVFGVLMIAGVVLLARYLNKISHR